MNPTHSYRCWAEIDLGALRGNLAWIRGRIGSRVKLLAVVKADAYGHGLPQIAATLMRSGADLFGVASAAEALAVRAVGEGWPILLLGSSLPEEVEPIVEQSFIPTISSLAEAYAFHRTAKRKKKVLPVHIKVDTGMGRLGFWHEEAMEPIRRIASLPYLKIAGLWTHFASAGLDEKFTVAQFSAFRAVVAALRKVGIRPPLRHMANSAALLFFPDSILDLVRPGYLIYGIIPKKAMSMAKFLRPAMSLKSRVIFLKRIPAGRSLSYGRMFTALRPMRVATVAVGYGDGYHRALSGRAKVLVGRQRCDVLGRVTMDQILVDVSRIPDVRVGDEVVLFGRQGREEITAQEVASWARTIALEILCSPTKRVPRVYVESADRARA